MKLTDPKWWTGQTDDQKARRAKARTDLTAIRQGMTDATDTLHADLATGRTNHAQAETERKEGAAERMAGVKAAGAAKREELRADKEGRRLGGYGHKRR